MVLLSRLLTDESKQELRCMVSNKLDKLLEYLDVQDMLKDIVYNKVETWTL